MPSGKLDYPAGFALQHSAYALNEVTDINEITLLGAISKKLGCGAHQSALDKHGNEIALMGGVLAIDIGKSQTAGIEVITALIDIGIEFANQFAYTVRRKWVRCHILGQWRPAVTDNGTAG